MLLKLSFFCHMHTAIDLFMPYLCLLLLNLKLFNTNLGFIWNTRLYARKYQNDATKKQSDHLENPNLPTNDRVFSIFVVNFNNNLSCIKNLIHIHIRHHHVQSLKSTKKINTYPVMPDKKIEDLLL